MARRKMLNINNENTRMLALIRIVLAIIILKRTWSIYMGFCNTTVEILMTSTIDMMDNFVKFSKILFKNCKITL